MTTKEIDKTVIAWPGWSEEAPGEPALVLTKYSDTIEITQEDNVINIDNHEVEAFIKILRQVQEL